MFILYLTHNFVDSRQNTMLCPDLVDLLRTEYITLLIAWQLALL